MRRHRNTKIIATLGPASHSADMIERLFQAGADIFRLNMSHGDHATHKRAIAAIRSLEKKHARPIAILADLQGPKIRIGSFKNGSVTLKKGQAFTLDLKSTPGNEQRVNLPHREIYKSLKPGTHLLIDDGKLKLKVTKNSTTVIETTVIVGGKCSNRKGVNIPDVDVPVSALTAKDKKDLKFALDHGADIIALSFVQKPEDLKQARALIKNRAALMAKIEKPGALKRIEKIIHHADYIMVARGDLGVEMLPEEVPPWQKRIVRKSRRAGKPVVIATQMLESMINTPTPTRAETSDVATAVYDGADAVMLSAETASGKYPVASVDMMDRIIKEVEKDPRHRDIMMANKLDLEHTTSDAISGAASDVAETIEAAAIITFTTSGSTTLRAARQRPTVPIMGLTDRLETARRLVLAWGVHAVYAPEINCIETMLEAAIMFAKKEEFARKKDHIVITAGVPFGQPGSTNLLRIAEI